MDIPHLKELIDVAQNKKAADLVLKNARIIDVFSHRVYKSDLAIYDGFIVGIGDYGKARRVIDLKSSYVCPSFIEGHIHIESSLLSPFEFAKTVIPHGTSACVIDPHEIANVVGLDGIKFMLEDAESLPMDIYCMLPSCVPATPFETAGAELDRTKLESPLKHPQVLGLAEMMNFPGVIMGQEGVLEKLVMARTRIIDGHCPSLSGEALCAYISAGITSEHEATSLKEAREKLSKGMYIMIREGSTAKNLENLSGLIKPETHNRLMFVSDDRHPHDLLTQGHLDFIVKKAISLGVDPIIAIKMASLNCAQYFGLKNKGAVACGFKADLITFKNLKQLKVDMVFKEGELVARAGRLIEKSTYCSHGAIKSRTMGVEPSEIKAENFKVFSKGSKMRVIEVVPNEIITRAIITKVKMHEGVVLPDIERDILKVAVIDRYSGKMGQAVGFIKGFGLREGAIASSVAHDSHNLIAVGTDDVDLAGALRVLAQTGGGLCCVRKGRVLAKLELPIGGLMSAKPAQTVACEMKTLIDKVHMLGSKLHNPFMALSFLALPVIPHLKITDQGLFSVDDFKFVDLCVK